MKPSDYGGWVEYPFTKLRTRMPELPMAPTEAADDVVAYSWIPEARIPPVHARYVHRHLNRLAREAGLGPIPLRWYGPAVGTPDFWLQIGAEDTLVGGMSGPAGIALLARLRGDALLNAIGHEVRHLTQAAGLSLKEREVDAELSGRAFEAAAVG